MNRLNCGRYSPPNSEGAAAVGPYTSKWCPTKQHYSFGVHQPIFKNNSGQMLLRVSYQMVVYFLTSSNECLCTTWKNTNRRNCVLLCSDHSNAVDSRQCTVHERVTRSCYLSICSVLFFSSPRSEGWPHHGHDGRTFSIYLCPLLF